MNPLGGSVYIQTATLNVKLTLISKTYLPILKLSTLMIYNMVNIIWRHNDTSYQVKQSTVNYTCFFEKKTSRGGFRKRCSENMQQMYMRAPLVTLVICVAVDSKSNSRQGEA